MKHITLHLYLFLATKLWAHEGHEASEKLSWYSWKLQPHILIMLLLMGIVYYRGYQRLRQHRSHDTTKLKRSFRYYYAGLIILLFALISPIDAMSDALAWVHMLQHTLILMVAAPLMALGGPSHISQWSVSQNIWKRYRIFLMKFFRLSRFQRPLAAWLLYMLVLSIWHIPTFYEAALKWERLHDLQHLLFFITSFFFWRVLFDPYQKGVRPLIGITYTFTASLHGIILGVLMTLSPHIWYAPYVSSAPLYGHDPLTDQQLAGLIMWMPAGLSYALGALALILKELRTTNPS